MSLGSGSRARIPARLCRATAGFAFIGAILGGAAPGSAHDQVPGLTREEPSTTFESIVADACSPCVRDSYAVAALPLAPLKAVGFGPPVTSMMSRGGEVRIEVVRAYPLGKREQQVIAMRATLSIKMGDGQLFPVATGLVDEEEVGMLATAVDDISKAALRRPAEEPLPDTMELEYHAGSLRVGMMRIRGDEVAYLQAGNIRVLRAPTPFETNSALFLPVGDLGALHDAIGQAASRIKKLRGP
jgi:hypothetical protein